MKPDILLDSDMLMHLALVTGQIDEEWEEDMPVRACDLKECRASYWGWIHELCETLETSAEHVLHCFTHRSTFRRDLLPTYKGGRKEKPVGYHIFKAELLTEKQACMFIEIEADDVISMSANHFRKAGTPYVVCSGDKDLDQVPGRHLWPWHPNPARVMTTISIEEAERNFWMQTLMGDSGDKIPGCPGVGPVAADAILAGVNPMNGEACWAAILKAYRKAYEKAGMEGADEAALLNARLVRLLRSGDYDPKAGRVRLWEPPSPSPRPSASPPQPAVRSSLLRSTSSSRSERPS